MHNPIKDWLVRTKNREILGPFTQRELLDELNKHTFSVEDEIAQSQGRWISAQTLTEHEADELTLTQTRNQTVTKSIHTSSVSTSSLNPAEAARDLTDLTPTPKASMSEYSPGLGPVPGLYPPPPIRRPAPRIGTFMATLCLVGGTLILWNHFRLLKHDVLVKPTPNLTNQQMESDSPFIKKIYELIAAGEGGVALKQLNQYHEKHLGKGELDYLIPYSALLVTEGESTVRAKKLLEQVLASPQATPQLKAHAHHWLGYILLGANEGDMGEGHFLESLQLNPKDAAVRFNLGRAYLKQEKFSQALEYLQLAEIEAPDLWLIHMYKGRAKAALGNTEEARAAFTMAMQASQDRWVSYIYYCIFLINIQEQDSAQAVLRKMLTRDPHYEVQSPAPWGFFQEKVNYTEYLHIFSSVMEKVNDEEKEMGRLYIQYLRNGVGAAESKRIELAAVNGGIFSRVLALKVVLDRDSSTDNIRTAMNRLPQSLQEFGYYAYVLRGEAKSRLGLFKEAQEDFQHALILEPRSAVSHWAYAVLLKKASRSNDAQNEIKNLLTYHPNYIPAIVSSHSF